MFESRPQDLAVSNEWWRALQGYAVDVAALPMSEALAARQAELRLAAQAEPLPNDNNWSNLQMAIDQLGNHEAALRPSLEMYAAGFDTKIIAQACGQQILTKLLDVVSTNNEAQKDAPHPAAPAPPAKPASIPKPAKRAQPDDDVAVAVSESSADLDLVAVYRKQFDRRPLLKAEEEVALAQAYHEGERARAKLADATLKPEERAELEQTAAAGKRAYDHLVEANLRLVYSAALRFRGLGVRFLDLIQEGNLGLMRAAELFDETRGIKFSVYATRWIVRNLSNAVGEKIIHVPREKLQAHKKMRNLEEMHLKITGEPITTQALAKELGLESAEVEDLRTLSRVEFSLNQTYVADEGDEVEFGSSFAATNDTVEEALESERLRVRQRILKEAFSIAFRDCRPQTREQYGRIIGLLINLEAFEESELTTTDIAQQLDVTRATISAIRLKFLNALQSEQVRELATKLMRDDATQS